MNDQSVDYTKIPAPDICKECGDDPAKWADAFIQIVTYRARSSGQSVIDHTLLKHWFANVMDTVRKPLDIDVDLTITALRERIEKLERKLTDLGSNANLEAYD